MEEQKTVLIVDDNEINRKILTKILSNDYDIIEAQNGKDALDKLLNRDWEISAVMLDLIMPEMDGFRFLKEIKENNYLNNIPVIVSTGIDDDEAEIAALKAGAWDFIAKPYNAELIRFRLKNAIDRSQLTAYNKLKYLSEYDELTGIFNKNMFFAKTSQMLLENKDIKFAFIRFDISRFNLINAFYGFSEGDKLLKYIADNLKNYASNKKLYTYGRIEADVFGFCMPFVGLEKTCELVESSKLLLRVYNLSYDIAPNFGIYIIEDSEMPVNLIYDRANLAAKQSKGNYVVCYSFYNKKMGSIIQKEQEIINEMNNALKKQQFEVYLQPKYSLTTRQPEGAEALVRWLHPTKGIIPPGEFIPVFERNGFITKLDYYMWEHVCIILKKWIDEGKKTYPVSVNVSRVNLYNPNLVEILSGLVDKYNIPANYLNLEITESAYSDNPVVMTSTINRLKKKGFVVMMDDFGSGYSSLNILKDIEVGVLKIDMKFLENSALPERGQNILSSVIHMAKLLNIPTIAEGVEKSEQVDFLNAIGCEYVQGYYFARPMTVENYEKLLESISEKQLCN